MKRGQTFTLISEPVTFVTEMCCNCGVLFAMTSDLRNARLREAETGSFYCPNGHQQHYVGKSAEQKAKDAERAVERLRVRLDAERDQRVAAERELKRQKRRTNAGVCPCCSRSFVQLARHMKTKHPEFGHADGGAA